MIPRLWRHRSSIRARRLPHVVGIASTSLLASAIAALVRRRLRARVLADTEPMPDPVFILGYWRSGTTALHHLLGADRANRTPPVVNCLFPHFFKTVGRFVQLHVNIADLRSGDGIVQDWYSPQEDEFGLMLKGAPSTYWWFAFTSEEPVDEAALTLDRLPPAEQRRWRETLRDFLQDVWTSRRDHQRMVVKSPTHTARVDVLLEMYPRARFIHLSRDPVEIIESNRRFMPELARRLAIGGGPSAEAEAALCSRMVAQFAEVYGKYRRTRPLIADGRLLEISHAELRDAPLATAERIYDWLGWDMEEGSGRREIEKHILDTAGHSPSSRPDNGPLRAEIAAAAPWYFEHFGYPKDAAAAKKRARSAKAAPS